MRKSKIVSFIFICIAALFVVGTFSYILDNYKTQSKNTVMSIQNVKTLGKSNFTIDEYETLVKKYEEMPESSFYSELSDVKIKKTTVTPVLTNKNYLDYNNISYEGEGITEAMEREKSSTAVISRTLADKMFYGDRAIGRTFKIAEVRYRITGIYNDKADILNGLFKDGKERIYLNYTGYDDYKTQKIHQLSCIDGSDASRLFLGAGEENFIKVNFDEKNMAVNDFTVVISFVLAIIISIYLIKIWIFTLQNTVEFFKRKLSKNYLLGAIGHNIPSVLIRILIIAGLPVGIFLLIIFVFSDFHIVYNYIDRENLFGISYMLEKLGEVLQNEREIIYGGNAYFINLYNGTMLMLLGLTPLVCAMLFFLYHSFVNLSDENPVTKYVVSAFFAAVTIISLIVSLVSDKGYGFLQIITLVTAIMILKCISDYLIRRKHFNNGNNGKSTAAL